MTTPAHTQITRSDLVSSDARTRLTMFTQLLLGAWYGLQQPRLVELGLQDTTSALAYKMPIAIGSSKWSQWVNGIKYRDVGELMLQVTVGDWSDGVRAELKKLQSDEWANFGWGMQPADMAAAAGLIPEQLLCTAIEAGETTASIENNIDGDTSSTTLKFFGQDKPVDPMGATNVTYSNLFTSTGGGDTDFAAAPMTLASIDRVWSKIRTIKAQNGKDFRDLTWKYTLVSPLDELKARRYFMDQGTRNDQVVETSGTSTAEVRKDNTAKGYGVEVIASPYLTTAGTWYPIATSRTSTKAPWISLTQIPANTVPMVGAFAQPPANANPLMPGFEWILDFLDSEMYKHGMKGVCPPGYVGIAAKRSVGVALTEPWRLFKCKKT